MSEAAATAPVETPTQESAPEVAQAAPKLEVVPDEPEAKPADPFRAAKHKVKIEGQELEVDYDELLKGYQLNKVVTQRSQEAAAAKKEAKEQIDQLARFLQSAKGDPQVALGLLNELGHDVEKLAEEVLWKKIQFEKMTPAEKEAYHAKKEAARLKEELDKRDAKMRSEQEIFMSQRAEQRIEHAVVEAIKSVGEQPTPTMIRRSAEIMDAYVSAHGELPSPAFVAKRLKEWEDTEVTQRFSERLTSKEVIQKLVEAGQLPQATIKAFQDYLLEKAAKPLPDSPKPSRQAASDKSGKAKPKKVGIDEWFKSLG